MNFRGYSIRDAKADSFALPFYVKLEGEALRHFQGLVNDDRTTISKFPEDFDLYFVGEFDQNTGKFEPVVPVHVKHASTLVQQ